LLADCSLAARCAVSCFVKNALRFASLGAAIFDIPPEGVRKIVLATNIAETSITIEDVVYVVDTGKVKENREDEQNQMMTLVETWVAKSSAKQRRGRAGRVKPGTAFHLFSSHTNDTILDAYQMPEMLRVRLDDLVLQILLLDLGDPEVFLKKAVNPPSTVSIMNSLNMLCGLSAVEREMIDGNKSKDGSGNKSFLTALGFHLATLPVEVSLKTRNIKFIYIAGLFTNTHSASQARVGKMLIYGCLFQCLDPCLVIAASLANRSPFMSPFDKREAADEAKKTFMNPASKSDHLTILNAYYEWKKIKTDRSAERLFLHENFLSYTTLNNIEKMKKQFQGLLRDIGFIGKGMDMNR